MQDPVDARRQGLLCGAVSGIIDDLNTASVAVRGVAGHPDRHRRFPRHRGSGDQCGGRLPIRARPGVGRGGGRRGDLRVRADGRTGGGGEWPRHLRDHPGAPRPAHRGGESECIVPDQPDDLDRRDRWLRAGAAAGHRRRTHGVDSAGRLRGAVGGVASEIQRHGERHRSGRVVSHRVRGGRLRAGTRLGGDGACHHPPGHPGIRVVDNLLVLRHRALRCGDDTSTRWCSRRSRSR